MLKTKKRTVFIGTIVIVVLLISTSSLVSYSKFGVANSFSTASGLIQVLCTKKEYVEIQKYPKVIVAKPTTSLQEYMQSMGFIEDEESRMGALLQFTNGDTAQYIVYSTNAYYSKWRWQE